MKDIEIPIERLDEAFRVDFRRGVLVWRVRPDSHFLRAGAAAMMNTRFAGRVAGHRHSTLGYVVLDLTIGGRTARTLVHRVIWAMKHRRWPASTIDHVDKIRDHNAIGNLREATKGEQMQNRIKVKNKTGFAGVWANRDKFSAAVQVGRERHRLGQFDTPQEAHAAYLKAKKRLHSHYVR